MAIDKWLIILSRSSHENVERILRDFMNEIRTGKRESSTLSTVSTVSTGSLSADEKEEWRQIRKELQSIGIPPEIFAQNHAFIIDILRALSENEIGCLKQKQPMEEEFSLGPP
jgi:hypothetical protein